MCPDIERPNVFAGPHVDRLKFSRADAETVALAIAEGTARLIPVWRSRCPLIRAPSPSAFLLEVGVGPLANVAADELILLGEYGGRAVFTTEIDRKSTRLNSSHIQKSRMPSSA